MQFWFIRRGKTFVQKIRLTKNNIGNIIERVINLTDYADIIM